MFNDKKEGQRWYIKLKSVEDEHTVSQQVSEVIIRGVSKKTILFRGVSGGSTTFSPKINYRFETSEIIFIEKVEE